MEAFISGPHLIGTFLNAATDLIGSLPSNLGVVATVTSAWSKASKRTAVLVRARIAFLIEPLLHGYSEICCCC